MMTTTTTSDDRSATASTTSKGAGNDNADGPEESRLAAVRQSAADAYQAARERTSAAYAGARDRAETARRRAADGIDSNPLAAVAGGLALGALAAALLPKTRREEELFGDVGRRLGDTAREAARAAREAGREQIEELGLNKDGVRRRLDDFTGRAVGSVKGSSGKGKAG